MKWLTIILLSISTIGFAESVPVKNLVFEGASIRGIAYAGVLMVLEEHGYTDNIVKVGGTSSGAITSLLFALGYSAAELEMIVSDMKLQKFNDGRFFFLGGIARTKKRYGWYRGQKFSNWLGSLIEEKTGDSEITFEDLHQRGYKDLYVTATCLNQQRLVVLSYETYPKMKVKDAVRISMSIPLYFQAVFVDSMGRIYSKQNEENNLDIMVDGGVIGNFPIQLFDSIVIDSNGDKHVVPNDETLGIRIDSEDQIVEDNKSKKLVQRKINGFNDFMTAFYIIIIESLNRNTLTEDDWKRTVSVSSVGITPRVRKLSNEQKTRLVQSGVTSTEAFLKNRNND